MDIKKAFDIIGNYIIGDNVDSVLIRLTWSKR